MSVEICAVGGYGEVGKNMTAVRYEDEVVILDMGLHLPNYIRYTEEEREHVVALTPSELKRVRAIPNDTFIKDWKSKVIAIVPSHAHLDHIGALPYLAGKYHCPIYGTPFTIAVLKEILRDQKIKLPNKLKSITPNGKVQLSKNLTLEFVHVTHSTPQSAIIALHTPDGVILYTNDFKFDNKPTLGKKPNYQRLEALGKEGILVCILDTLYADRPGKTPSESVAKEMLHDVMIDVDSRGKALLVTTFSSHIARLKSIVEYGKRLKRKPIFMGRSLAKYIAAAKNVGLIDLAKEGVVCRYGRQIRRKLKDIQKNPAKYLMVTTGHQGEPHAILSRMAQKELAFRFKRDDHIIFASSVIPAPINIRARKKLENTLQGYGIRIFRDIHTSGHGSIEEQREMVRLTQPKYILPGHSDPPKQDAFMRLARHLGYKRGSSVRFIKNGQRMTFS